MVRIGMNDKTQVKCIRKAKPQMIKKKTRTNELAVMLKNCKINWKNVKN